MLTENTRFTTFLPSKKKEKMRKVPPLKFRKLLASSLLITYKHFFGGNNALINFDLETT